MGWRVGHESDPAGYVPWVHCRWAGRWDDPLREFRTLYVAESPETALKEVFREFQPSVAAQLTRGALYPGKYVLPSEDLHPGQEYLRTVGPDEWSWRVLVEVEAKPKGRLVNLMGPDRSWVERHLSALLAEIGIGRLDTTSITSSDRKATQRLARGLFDEGVAGVVYPSNVASEPCTALFETRASLRVLGAPRAVTPELDEVRALGDSDLLLVRDQGEDNTKEMASRRPSS